MTDENKVGIYCITYNHSAHIRKCLDGFVKQKTNFKFEAIVFDDYSADGTREIIKEYAQKYPDIIKPIFPDKNIFTSIGIYKIFRTIIDRLNCKYIAFCEGDDYWIDENKLQTQVDFLENNPDFTGCFHKSLRKNVVTGEDICCKPTVEDIKDKDIFTIEDTICGYFIETCSVMYRFNCYKELLIETFPIEIINGDSYLIYFFSLMGKIKYIDKLMSVKTINETGIWNSTNQTIDEKQVRFWLEIINFPIEVRKLLDKFNRSLSYETPQEAMRQVLKSAINIKRYDIVEKAVQRFPEVFKTLITPIDKSAEVNYYRCKFKKYKKSNIALIIISTLLALLSIVLFLT